MWKELERHNTMLAGYTNTASHTHTLECVDIMVMSVMRYLPREGVQSTALSSERGRHYNLSRINTSCVVKWRKRAKSKTETAATQP